MGYKRGGGKIGGGGGEWEEELIEFIDILSSYNETEPFDNEEIA